MGANAEKALFCLPCVLSELWQSIVLWQENPERGTEAAESVTDCWGTGVHPSKIRRQSSCSAAWSCPTAKIVQVKSMTSECYPALPRVTGRVHLTSTSGTLQPNEFVEFLALG